jgi:carbamoyltransferase
VTIILGINAYHGDASACLIRDGKIVAAAEEERFRRIKHWAGFPAESVKYCLSEAALAIADVQHVAVNQDTHANLWKKIGFVLVKRPDLRLLADRIKNKRQRLGVVDQLAKHVGGGFKGEVHQVEHHLAHLSSAFHVSPFGKAVVVSVDGFGDFASAAWGLGSGGEISIDARVYFPHSLGIFYQALTQWLGFPNYGDEYKVMGLAPYGTPSLLAQMRQIVHLQDDGSFKLNLDFFRHHVKKVEYEWDNGAPEVGALYSAALVDLLGPERQQGGELTQRHKDIAHSVQAMYEEAFFHLLNTLHRRYGSDTLCLAGGCAMNSVANGKVHSNTPFKSLYVQSAAGDAGGAIGAAYVVWHALGGECGFVMDHAYWGPGFSDETIGVLLDSNADALAQQECQITHEADDDSLCKKTARAISEGKVVGWFQGRMEWGPRALGNRSILGDPRRADMKDILNLKIKRRESFRPFAPSVLRESVSEWFEHDDDVPFMMQVFQIRAEKREAIPAVTHVDGSGRLQTVDAEASPRYHRLISAFRVFTGVPMVLNTSFNENEPVVCKPEEALACFLRTKMDMLVMENWIIRRDQMELRSPAADTP